MTRARITRVVAIVGHIDLMQGAHDLAGAPSLVDAQIADDVGGLEAAIAPATAATNYGTARYEWGARCTQDWDLRRPPHFGGDRAGEAVAELRGVARNHPAAVTRVGARERAPVRGRR